MKWLWMALKKHFWQMQQSAVAKARKGDKVGERLILFFLSRATYGELWTLLRNACSEGPLVDSFQKDEDREKAEEDSLKEERSRNFCSTYVQWRVNRRF